MSQIDITGYDAECWSFQDDDGKPYPALLTRGCGCCQSYLKVTPENIAEAIKATEEWLEFLRELQPVTYPPEIE